MHSSSGIFIPKLTRVVKQYTHWLHTCWPAGSVEKLPEAKPDGSTTLPHVRITGDLTGVPLLKFAVDSGTRAVRHFVAENVFQDKNGDLDLVIIGAGVSGMAAAIEAHKQGLNFQIYEAREPFSTIIDFPKGKPIYTYPGDMTPAGDFQVSAAVKERLLDEMQQQKEAARITVTEGRVERVRPDKKGVVVHHSGPDGTTRASAAIIAIGRSGHFRKLGCPGEELDNVYHRLHDPREFSNKKVLVVGGGDSALEAAIALATAGAHVTLSYRGAEFTRPKPENIEKVRDLQKNPAAPIMVERPTSERVTTAAGYRNRGSAAPGSIRLEMQTNVREIREQAVELEDTDHNRKTIFNDVVFTMIGREAPLDFFRRSNIPIRGETRLKGWLFLALFLLFCSFIITWKSGAPTENWLNPWPDNMPQLIQSPGGWFEQQVNDRSTLIGTLAVSLKSRAFYYTLLYSLAVLVFGIVRIRRRRTPYITRQTIVLTAIQILPLFILPEIILPFLGYNGWFDHGPGRTVADGLFEMYIPEADYLAGSWPEWGHPRAYWRAYGFILAWPLMVYNVFTETPHAWWLIISFVQTFVLIPAIIYVWGKGAYCGWICSCGALAETVGDQQRHKMPHGPFWNRLNMAGQVILAVAFVLLLIRIGGWIWPNTWMGHSFKLLSEGFNQDYKLVNYFSYKWVVDVFLAGILGIGLYFKYSGRVWCRFFCPLAALMHIYTRFSKFRIFADKAKCISCNVCTSVCHQGIDIMNFANKGMPMEDPECVRCSACVYSCPTGVLQFGRYGKNGQIVYDNVAASPVIMAESDQASA